MASTPGWRGRLSLRGAVASDQYAGVDGTALNAHFANTPSSGTYTNNQTGVFTLLTNRCRATTDGSNSTGGDFGNTPFRNAIFTVPISLLDTNPFDASMDVAVIATTTGDGTGPFISLAVRHNGATIGSGTGDYLRVVMRNTTASVASMVLQRLASNTAIDVATVATGIPWANGTQLRIGVTVNGNLLSGWTEPYGGGARTQRGSLTLTDAYADTSHRLFALGVRSVSAFTVDYQVDNLTIGGVKIGEVTNYQVQLQRPAIDATSCDSSGTEEDIGGLAQWNARVGVVSLSGDQPQTILRRAILTPASVQATFQPLTTGTEAWAGTGYVQGVRVHGATKTAVLSEFALRGTSALTYST